METKGYVHVYTGNGKGKTTAAFGLALRALCAGKGVYVGQFVKSMKYNETEDRTAVQRLGPGIRPYPYRTTGARMFYRKRPRVGRCGSGTQRWARCADLLRSGEYDVVILDELTIARISDCSRPLSCWMCCAAVIRLLRWLSRGVMHRQALIDAADLVTEMCDVKHYYTQGVLSRDGIDR